ncbi:MAG: response regulator [Anaerolineales bacterium]|nr:response regulator [Anaerolineales bacterium]MCB8983657.1 response regulator [Ardenticatenaceae bacterium]
MATILIVDDSPTVRRTLGFTLKKHGYTALAATHGGEALEMLAETAVAPTTAVDLIIADVSMPEIDGITLLKLLRANPRYHNLPVIMLTASGQSQDRLHAEQEGANGFLTKPTSSHELLATVEQFLG